MQMCKRTVKIKREYTYKLSITVQHKLFLCHMRYRLCVFYFKLTHHFPRVAWKTKDNNIENKKYHDCCALYAH